MYMFSYFNLIQTETLEQEDSEKNVAHGKVEFHNAQYMDMNTPTGAFCEEICQDTIAFNK